MGRRRSDNAQGVARLDGLLDRIERARLVPGGQALGGFRGNVVKAGELDPAGGGQGRVNADVLFAE